MKYVFRAGILPIVLLLGYAPAASALVLSVDIIADSADREASGTGQSQTFNADATGIRLRLGTSSIEKSRFEFYFSSYDVDTEGEFNADNEWDAGANYVLTLSELPLVPFIKFGLGIGEADTDLQFTTSGGETTSKVKNLQLNAGAGLSYALTEKLSFTGGLEYTARSWQDMEFDTITLQTSDSVIRLGVGVDFRF